MKNAVTMDNMAELNAGPLELVFRDRFSDIYLEFRHPLLEKESQTAKFWFSLVIYFSFTFVKCFARNGFHKHMLDVSSGKILIN